jgi:FMN phosphatase YigB (HAD superfamily)
MTDPESPDDVYSRARDILSSGAVDVFTSDVFDTLVWRSVSTPCDQFHHVAAHLHDLGLLPDHVERVDFVGGRVHAERRARAEVAEESGHRECTLDEIWSRMPLAWRHHDHADWSRYADAEVAVEGELLGVHRDTVDLVAFARAQGVVTALVSDTYLSADQLTALLTAAGVPMDLVDHVITSSDHRMGKADGLLAHTAALLDCPAARLLHIGDNPESDIAAALAMGAHALATDIHADHRTVTGVLASVAEHSACTGTDGGVSAAVRSTLARAGRSADDPAFEFGAAFGGPLLAGFAAWASDTAADFGVDRIHYLLREGAFIADLAQTARPHGPTARLLHASRWVNMRAAVLAGTPYELARALLRKATLRPEHVVECFGVDLESVERIIGSGLIPDDRRWDAFDALAADDSMRSRIVEASTDLRRRLMRYLDRAVVPSSTSRGDRIVVCDIGWGATIQEGLTAVLAHEGWDVEVIGLYLLLSEPGVARLEQGAHIHSYLPSRGPSALHAQIITRNPELFEELCTPSLGTLVDLDTEGAPVLAEVPDFAAASRATARAAVLDYTATATGMGVLEPGRPAVASAEFRAALLRGAAATIQSPGADLAAELGSWSHDDVAGGSPQTLVDHGLGRALPYLNGADARSISMRDIFWLPGAAAGVNPVLTAQLTAAQLGIDPADLCPASELGEATLAVYRHGADDAVLLTETVPRIAPAGWIVLRVSGSANSIRAIRVDFGEHAGVVELGHLDITFGSDDPSSTAATRHLSIDRLDDPRLRWAGGRPLGTHHAVVADHAHVVLSPDASLVASCTYVSVQCVYRAWRTDDTLRANPLPAARRQLAGTARRLLRRAQRPGQGG